MADPDEAVAREVVARIRKRANDPDLPDYIDAETIAMDVIAEALRDAHRAGLQAGRKEEREAIARDFESTPNFQHLAKAIRARTGAEEVEMPHSWIVSGLIQLAMVILIPDGVWRKCLLRRIFAGVALQEAISLARLT